MSPEDVETRLKAELHRDLNSFELRLIYGVLADGGITHVSLYSQGPKAMAYYITQRVSGAGKNENDTVGATGLFTLQGNLLHIPQNDSPHYFTKGEHGSQDLLFDPLDLAGATLAGPVRSATRASLMRLVRLAFGA